MSGAHAAALAAGCCCLPGDEGPPDPDGCPQIGNTQPRTPADSGIDVVQASFSLQSRTIIPNTDGVDFSSPCLVQPPPEFTEEAMASASSAQAAWDGGNWEGCGTADGTVSALQHGIEGRLCGNRCLCLGNAPGCGSIQCCGDSYAIPRLHQSPAGFVAYSLDDVIQPQQVACPACCGGIGQIDVGYNGASWTGGVAVRVGYGCLSLADVFGIERCQCPGLPPGTVHGYYLLAAVRVVSQRAVAQGAAPCPPLFLGLPSSASFGRHAGLWVKPCCSADDSVRGTYQLAMPAASSGTTGSYSWLTSRSGTATVS